MNNELIEMLWEARFKGGIFTVCMYVTNDPQNLAT